MSHALLPAGSPEHIDVVEVNGRPPRPMLICWVCSALETAKRQREGRDDPSMRRVHCCRGKTRSKRAAFLRAHRRCGLWVNAD